MEKAWEILAGFWGFLAQMSPYLLLGFLVAGALSVLVKASWVERHLGGRGLWPVVKAALLGVPLPLCSCGVIPVSASLRRHGASRGATTAFLISTPQTGVDSIFVTFSLLGWVVAVFRPIFALVSGVVGGAVVTLAYGGPAGNGSRPGRGDDDRPVCHDACCAPGRGGRLWAGLKYAFYTLPGDIGKALLVGLVVAAGISAVIPEDYFSTALPPGIGQIAVLMAAGIPVYVCATASVPVAAALIHAGVTPGAAFAFLMTGPATNAATIATVWKVMGRRTALLYLLTVAVAALGGGLLLDQIVTPAAVRAAHHAHAQIVPGWAGSAAAAALLALLAVTLVGPRLRRRPAGEGEAGAKAPEPIRLRVTGMTCSHCADSVRRALLAVAGVRSATVNLAGGVATVQAGAPGPDLAELRRAITAVGYGSPCDEPAAGVDSRPEG